jgi:hypothetical protein
LQYVWSLLNLEISFFELEAAKKTNSDQEGSNWFHSPIKMGTIGLADYLAALLLLLLRKLTSSAIVSEEIIFFFTN